MLIGVFSAVFKKSETLDIYSGSEQKNLIGAAKKSFPAVQRNDFSIFWEKFKTLNYSRFFNVFCGLRAKSFRTKSDSISAGLQN